eukprot:2605040-Pyramimonas_sp.AAC.2
MVAFAAEFAQPFVGEVTQLYERLWLSQECWPALKEEDEDEGEGEEDRKGGEEEEEEKEEQEKEDDDDEGVEGK